MVANHSGYACALSLPHGISRLGLYMSQLLDIVFLIPHCRACTLDSTKGLIAAVAADNAATEGASAMETDETSKASEAGSAPAATEPSTAAAPAAVPEESEEVKTHRARLADVKRILAGSLPIALHLEFLYSHNHADLQVGPLIRMLTRSHVNGLHVSQNFSHSSGSIIQCKVDLMESQVKCFHVSQSSSQPYIRHKHTVRD